MRTMGAVLLSIGLMACSAGTEGGEGPSDGASDLGETGQQQSLDARPASVEVGSAQRFDLIPERASEDAYWATSVGFDAEGKP